MQNTPPHIKNAVKRLRETYAWLLATFKNLSLAKKVAVVLLALITLLITYRQLTYVPGYCPATKHYHTDAELIEYSKKELKAEAAQYGGIDGFEKWLIERNYHPEIAGRDFNPNDPECCKVYRDDNETKRGCGTDEYPVCVRLNFPPLKDIPKDKPSYKREGRTYLFDDCGNHRRSYYLS